jgi:RNA polymerase sigma factor (sigma-70 family)
VRERGVDGGFEELYQRDWAAVVALGWSLTGSRPVGEELAQDAFLDAYRRWSHVGMLANPGAWVRRAVANRAVSRHRHRRVVAEGAVRLATEARVRQGAVAQVDDDDEDFWAAVRSLPARQAQCVALRYLEDRSIDEIALVLDMRPATVRVHLMRGRRAIAEHLATGPEELP